MHRRWIQRKATRASGAQSRVSIPDGGGARLDDKVRSPMEAQLGSDLSQVTVHTGSDSAAAAEAMGARAFTDGSRVHFAAGQFNPGTREGDKLIAHELTHVAQGGGTGVQRKAEDSGGGTHEGIEVSEPHEAAEVEADAAADRISDHLHGGGAARDPKKPTKALGGVGRKIFRNCADGSAGKAGPLMPGPVAAEEHAGGEHAAAGPPGASAAGAAPKDAAGKDGAAGDATHGKADDAAKAGHDKAEGAPPLIEEGGKKGGPLSEEKALSVLDDAFKGYKAITKGTVKVLEQADFQAAYDKIYGTSKYSWDKYVKPKFGNLNGFAEGGVNYINKNMANTGTVPHEMLHNNAAADWRGVVGNQFDEGATDYLKQHALKKAGLSSPNSYEAQLGVVKAFLATGVAEDQLFTAYLKGGAATIVEKWVDEHCAGTWAEVKAASQAEDYAKAKVKLKPKAADAKKDAKGDAGAAKKPDDPKKPDDGKK